MQDQRATREIRKLIYSLKRRWGFPVIFYTIESSIQNLETGKQVIARSRFIVSRAIVLPAEMLRKFSYDLSFIATNKNFTYGGFYDTSKRTLIVDCQDIPAGNEIKIGNYFVYSGRQWTTAEVHDFEFETGKVIVGSEVEGNLVEQYVDVSAESEITLSQTGAGNV